MFSSFISPINDRGWGVGKNVTEKQQQDEHVYCVTLALVLNLKKKKLKWPQNKAVSKFDNKFKSYIVINFVLCLAGTQI